MNWKKCLSGFQKGIRLYNLYFLKNKLHSKLIFNKSKNALTFFKVTEKLLKIYFLLLSPIKIDKNITLYYEFLMVQQLLIDTGSFYWYLFFL